MTAARMHQDEPDIDAELARALLAAQFPHWSHLPLFSVPSPGTVNAVYRLGEAMCVRLPRLPQWADCLQVELRWLPAVAGRVSLAVPEPLAAGRPGLGYLFTWAVYGWLPGQAVDGEQVLRAPREAERLARFVLDLRQIDPAGAPPSSRDQPLRARDAAARRAICAAGDLIDAPAALTAWESSLRAPDWPGPGVWTHGDLLPSNLLQAQGRLTAVIDFGNMGAGDPAVDVIPAWAVFGGAARRAFRRALEVDDATWARSRGMALHQALLVIPYYRQTHPAFAAWAVRTVAEVVADVQEHG